MRAHDLMPLKVSHTDLIEYRYAGWMGTIAARHEENDGTLSTKVAFEEAGHRLAAIAGTSTCHVVQVRHYSSLLFKFIPFTIFSEP